MKPDNFAITHFCCCDFADGCRPHDSRQQPCAIMRCDPIWRFSRQPFRFSASKTRIAMGRASPCSNRCASTPKAGARVAAMAVSRVKPWAIPIGEFGDFRQPTAVRFGFRPTSVASRDLFGDGRVEARRLPDDFRHVQEWRSLGSRLASSRCVLRRYRRPPSPAPWPPKLAAKARTAHVGKAV